MTRRSSLLRYASSRPTPYVCLRCQNKRHVAQRFLEKKARGREQWAGWAEEIRNGKRQSMLDILEARGFVNAIAGERHALDHLMVEKRIGAYVGVDPTAPSLHVGHLLPLMALFWMHLHGFHTVSLIGGSTAKIGDPSGRTTDREKQTSTERKANLASMHYQMKRVWANLEKIGRKHGYEWEEHWHRELVNNAMWWNKLPMIDVLKLLGPAFRMGTMLTRDTVKTKLESKDGMSFSEFCYPIMQAWDWWQMYEEKGIQLQIGGADQFGNIVAGVEAVKHVLKTHPNPDIRVEDTIPVLEVPYGITVPLLTTSSGEKFGKSAGNAIWLDQQMTSVYDMYGFLLRTPDDDVRRYLNLFTFYSPDEVESIVLKHENDPSLRTGQHAIARELVELIHGETAAKQAEAQHAALRKQSVSAVLGTTTPTPTPAVSEQPRPQKTNPLLTHQDARKRQQGTFISPALNPFAAPTDQNTNPGTRIVLPKSLIYNQPIARVLYAAGLVSSRSEGHRLAAGRGAYIGSQSSDLKQMNDQLDYVPAKLHDPAQTWRYVIRDEAGHDGRGGEAGSMQTPGEEGVLILRTGKWKVRVIRIVSDELFETLDVPEPPGWSEFKAQQASESSQEAWDATSAPSRPKKAKNEGSGTETDRAKKEVDKEENLSPWDWENKEMAKVARESAKSQANELPGWVKPKRKDAWDAVKEGHQKGMAYFQKQGASKKLLDEASYRGWDKRKKSSSL